MKIKDLAVAKELSHEERAAVRGGVNQINFDPQSQSVIGGFGPTSAVQIGPIDTNTNTVVNVSSYQNTVTQTLSAVESELLGSRLSAL